MKRLTALFSVYCACAASWAQYTIYPVPQKMTAQEGTASFSSNVCVVCDDAIDGPTRDRVQQVLREHGLTADFTGGQQQCTSVIYLKVDPNVAVPGKFDAHTISLSALGDGMASLTITGQNTDATFMGLASLEQMLDRGITALPCVSIEDYADQQQRGIVEGYYGYPYSVEVKKDLMRFMMRMKMNSYMYGAKSDPFHLSRWTEAYPATVTDKQKENGWLSQEMVEDICRTSAETKVNFIWSIHPGDKIISSTSVVNDIMAKYDKMYRLGVRQFGLFVDDVGVPKEQDKMELNARRVTELQAAIEKKWNTPDALPADTVKPLNFVPQIYCYDFAGGEDVYKRFFEALATTPDHIIIYTTGRGVWSVPNTTDFNKPKSFLGRDVAWWWNYPCNDNADSQLYPMDMYQNFVDMPAVGSTTLPRDMNAGIGIVCNPMQQGEVAKIPLFSAADYAWNNSGFVNKTSWAAAFPFILRDEVKANALKTLAPYLTKNDPSGKFPSTTDAKTRSLVRELLDAIDVVKDFAESDTESDRLLWRDLSPWVLKLEQMLHAAELLIDAKSTTGADRDTRWDTYTKGVALTLDLETKGDFTAYTLEGMYATEGTPHVAQPAAKFLSAYLNTLKTTAVKDMFGSSVTRAVKFTNTSYYPTVTTSGNDVYAVLAANTYAPGEYIGFALPQPTRVAEMLVTDTLVQHHSVRISPDGNTWTRLEPTGSNTRTLDDYVKYVIVANESDAPTTFKINKNVLRLTLVAEPTVSSITAPTDKDHNDRKNIFDGDVTTYWAPYQNQANNDVIRLNLSSAAPIRKVRFVLHNTNDDYMQTGRIEISTSATTGYTRLSPEGSSKNTFTLADMTPLHTDGTPYVKGESTSEAYIYGLTFNAKGKAAQYVRFYNQAANTSKWIRIAEFSPIFDINRPNCDDHEEICDGLPHTAALIKAGETIDIHTLSAYGIEKAEVFTNHGILTLSDISEKATLTFDEDTYVYEVVFTVSDDTPALNDTLGTGLRNVETDTSAAHVYHDLSGRRLTTLPAHGLYIMDGKKVMR